MIMTEQNKPEIPLDTLMALHESKPTDEISQDDAEYVAGLFKTVGNELYTVDNANVSGPGAKKALQLEQGKVFNAPIKKLSHNPVQRQAPVVPQPVPVDPPVASIEPSPLITPVDTSNANELLAVVKKLETKINKIYNIVSKLKRDLNTSSTTDEN